MACSCGSGAGCDSGERRRWRPSNWRSCWRSSPAASRGCWSDAVSGTWTKACLPIRGFALELRRRWTDGTSHLIFDPVELLERLAALVPRPRINLVLYYGVFALRAAGRRAIVPARDAPVDSGAPDRARSSNANWAGLMQRSFGFDVLACPRCPGWLRLVALIHQAAVVRRILTHLGLPSDQPVLRPSRDSPEAVWVEPP